MRCTKLLVLFMSIVIGGCSTTKLPPTNAYDISIASTSGSNANTALTDKVIRIAIPRSTAAIMSRNILYQDQQYSLNAYAFSKWSDTPNRMLSNLFLTSIGDSGIFKVALPADSRGKSDYILESSLQQFHQQIDSGNISTAKIRIGFYLIETKSGKVIATREFSSSEKTASKDAKGGVQALNEAARLVNKELLAWLASLDY